ncbi:class I SAM-dependent methyltransferase [Streptomyces sp. NPDC091278]|uniref:class I SAM-dependent methyltransferase n=1 Tax=Streptomyces sp. NPDC091278 TaxID=3155301 RepID=UPI00344C09D8
MTGLRSAHRSRDYWDEVYADHTSTPAPLLPGERHLFADRTGAAPGQTVVDIGCGLGLWTATLAASGMLATGYDCSPVAVARARELHPPARYGRLAFEVCDIDVDQDLAALRPGSVDLVTLRHVLPLLDPRIITDIRRWLRPDGVLHVTTRVSGSYLVQMTAEAIRGVGSGWRSATHYRVTQDSSTLGIVLQGPRGTT